MNPERWQRIKKLLEAALERPPSERADFLDQTCGSDPELRKEVESFIDYQDEAESFLESPLVNENENQETSGPMIGRTLSHYKIREEIGRGGMGEVYVAEEKNSNERSPSKSSPKLLPRTQNVLPGSNEKPGCLHP